MEVCLLCFADHIFGVKPKNSLQRSRSWRIPPVCIFLESNMLYTQFILTYSLGKAWDLGHGLFTTCGCSIALIPFVENIAFFFYWIAFVCCQKQLCIFIYVHFWSVPLICISAQIITQFGNWNWLPSPSIFIFEILVTHISLPFHINYRIIFIYKKILLQFW